MTRIKARPTIYKGIQMRSRLEAKYAKRLDDSPKVISWKYEPVCYADETGEYLPDFLVTTESGRAFIEVKPHVADLDEALRKMHIIRATVPTAALGVMVGDEDGSFHLGPTCATGMPCNQCAPPVERDVRLKDLLGPAEHYGDEYDGNDIMVCPSCDNPSLHALEAHRSNRDTNGYSSGVIVRFTCECCDMITNVSFQSHKGLAYASVYTRRNSEVT